jgi:hypothetical protein
MLSFELHVDLSGGFFHCDSPTKTLYQLSAFLCAAWLTNFIRPDVITFIIFFNILCAHLVINVRCSLIFSGFANCL